MLSPPMLVEDPSPWLILHAASRGSAGPASPFVVGPTAFHAAARGASASGSPSSVLLMAYDAGRQYDPGASFEIKPALVRCRGRDRRGGEVRPGQGGGRGRRLPSVPPPDHARRHPARALHAAGPAPRSASGRVERSIPRRARRLDFVGEARRRLGGHRRGNPQERLGLRAGREHRLDRPRRRPGRARGRGPSSSATACCCRASSTPTATSS